MVDTPLGLSCDTKAKNLSIFYFATKCKLKVHSLIHTRKKGVGALRWD
jgi:hypothetical protein